MTGLIRALGALLFSALLACTLPGAASARGALRVGEEQSPGTLNPMFPDDMYVVRATELLFDGLVGFNLANQATEPRIASSWSLAPNGQDVTFRLDPRATFHDGQAVTADDVVFTVEAMRAQLPWFRDVVVSARATDPQTVVVELLRRRDTAPQALEDLTFKILPRHVFPDGKISPASPFSQEPIGTGPFKLVQRQGNNIELTRFDARAPKPTQLESIVLMSTPDPKKHKDAIKANNLGLLVRVQPKDVKELRAVKALRVFDYVALDWWYLGHNHRGKHTGNKLFRKAVTAALNLDALREAHLGDGATISGPWAAEDLRNPHAVPPPKQDVAGALALLQEAGYTFDANASVLEDKKRNPVELTMIVQPPLGAVEGLYTDLTAQFQELGIVLNVVKPPDLPSWVAEVKKGKGYDLVLGRWRPTPGDYLRGLFHSTGSENWFGYKNPQVDRKLEELGRSTSASQYLETLRALNILLWDDQPYTFLWSLKAWSAYNRDHYQNVERIHPFHYFSHVADWDQVGGGGGGRR
jgi:peptide/nickel transport system substrate-binding protein